MRAIWFILKLPLKILMAPVILSLTLFVWICVGIVYVSGLVLGLISMVVALLGVAVLITYSLQNGIILLVIAFLISPYGLPMAAIWLLGKVQDLKSHSRFGLWIICKTSERISSEVLWILGYLLEKRRCKKVSIPIPIPWHIS